MLGDASLEVLQKQRVADKVVCCSPVLLKFRSAHTGVKVGERNEEIQLAMRGFSLPSPIGDTASKDYQSSHENPWCLNEGEFQEQVKGGSVENSTQGTGEQAGLHVSMLWSLRHLTLPRK